MIKKYTPTQADIKIFLNRISERVKINNEKVENPRQFEQRL